MQAWLQHIWLPEQTDVPQPPQVPFWQATPVPQPWPHEPQLLESVLTSVHPLEQHVWPTAHAELDPQVHCEPTQPLASGGTH
jgi:hypothetical protein